MACMNNLSDTIILALSLLDLPIDINNNVDHSTTDADDDQNNYGSSWYFLTCDSNDDYINIVKEILVLCTYYQIRELCFMRGPIIRNKKQFQIVNGDIVMNNNSEDNTNNIVPSVFIGSVISRATPKCKLELRIALVSFTCT